MLYKRLRELGLTESQVSGVVELLLEGTPVQITPTSFSMDSDAVKITQNHNAACMLSNFKIEIAGLNPMQIKSVQLPTFDYDSTEILALKVEILPLASVQALSKLPATERSSSGSYMCGTVQRPGEEILVLGTVKYPDTDFSKSAMQ